MATKHIVGFSGGIDSQTCAGVVLDQHGPDNVILLNSDAGGNEHPITEEFVDWYSRNVHPVVRVSAIIADLGDVGTKDGFLPKVRRGEFAETDPLTFDTLAYIKDLFPSSRIQFCTEYLKLVPQKRWMKENLEGVDYVRYTGVRRDESQKRRNAAEQEWDAVFDCPMVRPLVAWTKKQCFDFCLKRGEKINELYTMGFGRVGCAPCVNSGKDDIREWAARAPEMIDKVRRWEARVGKTFFRHPKPDGKGGIRYAWVDEVVKWAKTARGGKQALLPMVEAEAESGSCSSKYGLCE